MTTTDARGPRRISTRTFTIIGLAVALLIACFVSLAASGAPDGLEYVAEGTGFSTAATDHALEGSPLADYSAVGVEQPVLSNVLAGVVGCLLTLLLAVGLSALLRVRTRANA